MTTEENITESELLDSSLAIAKLKDQLNTVLFGSEDLVDLVVIAQLARGHILLEGMPGLGKTELAKGLSKSINCDVKRVQFTPDLLPGDITGNPILQEENGKKEFIFHFGPIFTNILLADEINRASPKTQSALLEAMQEKRVTVLGKSYPLPNPFFVVATQNPIELEGTYPLPEAQLDRFLFKLKIEAPKREVLTSIILNRELGVEPVIEPVIGRDQFLSILELVRLVAIPKAVASYIAKLVTITHEQKLVKYGAGPRAAIAMASACRAVAFIDKRRSASFEDVKRVALPILRHRLILDYTAKIDGITEDDIINEILVTTDVLDRDLPNLIEERNI